MSPLIAKREKLFGPLQLVLIGVLFAVSFYFLLPRQDTFEIAKTDAQDDNSTAIGELDLAYLKARSASGEQSVDETSRAVVALVRTGQVDAAKELLDQQPDASIGAQQRFVLDLEMARVEYFSAKDQDEREFRKLELLNRIQLLINNPTLRTDTNLLSSVELSEQLNTPQTSIRLYKLLATHDIENASDWYGKCARTATVQGQHSLADECFQLAITTSATLDGVFDIQLAQLNHTSENLSKVEQDKVLNQLRANGSMSIEQRETLAKAMLAIGRADLAYVEYAILAEQDKENQITHLLSAAKWAEGSNSSLAAAMYIDQAADLSNGVEKIALLERAERLLIAAGENETAFARLIARIDDQPNNEELLEEGIVRARQLGKPDFAAKWNEQLLTVNPVNIEAVLTQADLALASRDLPKAARWSRHAVSLAPNSPAVRTRHAQIVEWNGDPAAAMREWEWLAHNYPTTENTLQLIRLAELNRDSGVAVKALENLVRMTPNDDENIAKLVKFYELEGTPIAAATMLNELQRDNGMRAFPQREQARLYQRHSLYPEALVAWTTYADTFGQSTEETLNRMELYWRLNQRAEAAEVSKRLIGTSNASEATPYQVRLLSEIAWRYKTPELSLLVKPLIAGVEDDYNRSVLSKQLVSSLEDSGKNEQAVTESVRLWKTSGSNQMAFTAMNLAFKTGQTDGIKEVLADTENTANLRKRADYWILAASIQEKNGEKALAYQSRQKALALDPTNTTALSGMLWGYIDTNNIDAMGEFIEKYKDLAESEPELWSPIAIAHLQIGLPELSLTWFDRQLDKIETDYNMLLTYADALEYAGRAEPARKVRLYAIQRLRPVLTEGTIEDQDDLLRQYAKLLNRYGSAEDKERLAQWMLDDAAKRSIPGEFWREDIAISWLMATQRHENARLVMAKLHEQRLQAPAWQSLALAMASKNTSQIRQIIDGAGNVSVGNHILALRQVGQDKEAYKLATGAINSAPSLSDREIARSQYSAMRSEKPSYTAARVKQTSLSGLGIQESGFTIRHSLVSMNIGFAVDYTERSFTSDSFNLSGDQDHSNIALTLFHGDRSFGGLVSAGFRTGESDDLMFASTSHYLRNTEGTRTLTADLAYNEASTDSSVFRLAGIQNRFSLGYEQTLGQREYMKLQADMRDISTRVQQSRIARGLSARVEFGLRGNFGSNAWSTSVAAAQAVNDVVSELPAELDLSRFTTLDTLIRDKSTSLSVGASLSRGGVASPYPQVSSPRYYLNANVGQVWPDPTLSAQLDGGAGFRVLGGDELSFGFSHDTQPFNSIGNDNNSTSVGVNYSYHF